MERQRHTFVVGSRDSGSRLDAFLGRFERLGSRTQVAVLIREGAVTVDGSLRPKSFLLSEGQTVVIEVPEEPKSTLLAEELPISIRYEDQWLMVVDKPAGMPVHPSRGHASGTMVNALIGHGAAGGEEFRPGVVHRLDKDTTGLLVVAKAVDVHRKLTLMMRRREVDRRYLALVHGSFAVDSGTIEAPIGRDPARRQTMAVGGAAARDAVTHFTVLERLGDYTLVEARLETGRTHQIRVHFLAIGHPVVGDPVYARRDPLGVGRQFLHSHRLAFVHPITEAEVNVQSPLPADLAAALARLKD